jgi:hypothetical protein
MGNSMSNINKINFEDMQIVIKNPEIYLIINTLPITEQSCLIINTINAEQEESIINKHMKQHQSQIIIVYGKNCNDETVQNKYKQLNTIGFYNIFIYTGGLFEWLIMQDIYGTDMFPTTKKELDFLKYKPISRLNISLLEY